MAKKIIIINPDEWDADIIDCPFVDLDNYCGLISVGTDIECNILEDRSSCSLNGCSVEVSLAISSAELFYVQKPDETFGGQMHFWTNGDHGYAPQITAARVFTLEEIRGMPSIKYAEKIAWPKDYIDAKAVDNMVASKDCDPKASHKVVAMADN